MIKLIKSIDLFVFVAYPTTYHLIYLTKYRQAWSHFLNKHLNNFWAFYFIWKNFRNFRSFRKYRSIPWEFGRHAFGFQGLSASNFLIAMEISCSSAFLEVELDYIFMHLFQNSKDTWMVIVSWNLLIWVVISVILIWETFSILGSTTGNNIN